MADVIAETMILSGFVGFVFAVVNLIHPLGWFKVSTRKHAAVVAAASLAVFMIGVALNPRQGGPIGPLITDRLDTTTPTDS